MHSTFEHLFVIHIQKKKNTQRISRYCNDNPSLMMDSFSQKKKKIKSVIFNSKICQSKHTTHAFSNIISTFQKLHEQMAMEDSFVEEWEKKSGKKKLEEVEVL